MHWELYTYAIMRRSHVKLLTHKGVNYDSGLMAREMGFTSTSQWQRDPRYIKRPVFNTVCLFKAAYKISIWTPPRPELGSRIPSLNEHICHFCLQNWVVTEIALASRFERIVSAGRFSDRSLRQRILPQEADLVSPVYACELLYLVFEKYVL